jgi:SAM-dependent methyltransferase
MPEHLASNVDRVRQLFDAKATTWSAKYAPDGRLTSRLDLLAAELGRYVPAEGRLLDLGCGTGELARAAAAAGLQVTAADISAEMLRQAAGKDPSNTVDWVLLDPGWRTLPFEIDTFDVVLAASVLEYVDDPSRVLGECARLLRPCGAVLCTVPDIAHPVRWLEFLATSLARLPQIRAASRRWPRLRDYLTYLQLSRHRRPARWWHAAAALGGLHPVPRLEAVRRHAPLSLLAFQRPCDIAEEST